MSLIRNLLVPDPSPAAPDGHIQHPFPCLGPLCSQLSPEATLVVSAQCWVAHSLLPSHSHRPHSTPSPLPPSQPERAMTRTGIIFSVIRYNNLICCALLICPLFKTKILKLWYNKILVVLVSLLYCRCRALVQLQAPIPTDPQVK